MRHAKRPVHLLCEGKGVEEDSLKAENYLWKEIPFSCYNWKINDNSWRAYSF